MGRQTKKVKSAGRFGPRYGLRVRRRIAEIEGRSNARHACPRCQTGRLKRVSTAIWQCRKCDHKFAGGAYVPFTSAFKRVEVQSVPTIDAETEIESSTPALDTEPTTSVTDEPVADAEPEGDGDEEPEE